MQKVKSYYDPEKGYILIDHKGNTIHFDDIQINTHYIDASSKAGNTKVYTGATATITFEVEIMNEHPNKNMSII